jgi:hypothetical protein
MLMKSNQYGLDHFTFTNNWFGTCGTGIQLDDAASATKRLSYFRFYNNTFNGCTMALQSGTASNCTGCEFRGNIGFPGSPPSDGWTVQYNWTAGGSANCTGTAVCDHNTTRATYGFDPLLYHLLSSSPLVGALGSGSGLSWIPAADLDGQARPQNTNYEPGADEQ